MYEIANEYGRHCNYPDKDRLQTLKAHKLPTCTKREQSLD